MKPRLTIFATIGATGLCSVMIAFAARPAPAGFDAEVTRRSETNTAKQALVAILSVLWIYGLWNQLQSLEMTLLYLLLTFLMIAGLTSPGTFTRRRAKAGSRPPREHN